MRPPGNTGRAVRRVFWAENQQGPCVPDEWAAGIRARAGRVLGVVPEMPPEVFSEIVNTGSDYLSFQWIY